MFSWSLGQAEGSSIFFYLFEDFPLHKETSALKVFCIHHHSNATCPHWHSSALFPTTVTACLQPGNFPVSPCTLCNSLLPVNWRVSTGTLLSLQVAPMWFLCGPADSHRATALSACSHYQLLITSVSLALQGVASWWLREFRAALARANQRTSLLSTILDYTFSRKVWTLYNFILS